MSAKLKLVMLVFNKINKNQINKVIIFVICLILGFGFAKIYQPQWKTERLYKQALKDYQNENYQNSYYLFSKIGYMSSLKPMAIYRQAMCAKALGDKKSELKRYQQLFKHYSTNKLAPEAKYQAGQIIVDENPNLALKYFQSVSKSNIDDDYKIAADYYKARIAASKIRYSNKILSRAKVAGVEKSFRHYLQTVPDGRLAVSVAVNWKKFNPNIKSEDVIYLVRAYYLAGLYKDAMALVPKAKTDEVWALKASSLYKLYDYQNVKNIVEEGVVKYSDNVDVSDYRRAVDDYVNLYDSQGDKLKYTTKLLSLAKGKKKDYIWNKKCSLVQSKDKFVCYRDLYKNFPDGDFAENAMVQVFMIGVRNKNYQKCKDLAQEFLKKYPDSKFVPQVMFWAGKIEQTYYHSPKYSEYFQNIINNYPDSYYAYRAYWMLKGVNSSTIPAALEFKPVEYPYRYPDKNSVLYHLIEVQDYDMILKYTDDEFIKSWVEFQKGNYATSMIIAREAMDKIKVKPPKTDLRWRLVYPQNYYKQVQNYATQYNNNDALMMAIIREESSFNSDAQSGVGAIGLMQLMPSTAHDIGQKHGITFNTSYLFNPELNIRLGNLYYSTIKGMLNNMDVSAIAAYNGGIGSVTRWKSTFLYNDTDEFVEQIPYDETKNYVEKVFRSYWNYTRIYQK